jgi:hypothetical protein
LISLLRFVAEPLGHASMKMTTRYAHLSPAFLSAEVGLLDPPATISDPAALDASTSSGGK